MGDRERIIGDGLVLLAGSRGTRGDPEELVRTIPQGPGEAGASGKSRSLLPPMGGVTLLSTASKRNE